MTNLVVRLLGPVEVRAADEKMTSVSGPMQRVLLALLAIGRGHAVTTHALVDALWDEEFSRERELNLHSHVSALRRLLAQAEPGLSESRLERFGGGYRLAIADDWLDVSQFHQFARDGRRAVRAGEMASAAASFGHALRLWRGPALADAAPLCPRLAGDAASLEEMRAGVVEQRAECRLALGWHREVAFELSALRAFYPCREQLIALLMVALCRSGRRGEALAVFDQTRRVLAAELGLDPGPSLRSLQARVLADDPSLAGAVT